MADADLIRQYAPEALVVVSADAAYKLYYGALGTSLMRREALGDCRDR